MFNIDVCHEDMTGKRGGECCGKEYECHGNKYAPFLMEFLRFDGKYLYYLIFDMSLCYITNDVIDPFLKL